MLIDLSRVLPNPHRDLARNPLEPEQIAHVGASIERTGFWENVVVREHPTDSSRFELAYGHNRLAALRNLGETSAEFIVKPLSDYDMLVAMIDENATQRNQTARIVNENIYAAVRLAEHLLTSTSTVEEFNAVARPSLATKKGMRPSPDGCQKTQWNAQQYSQAKGCLASGEGLGKDFIKHFMPITYGNDVLQIVLDSVYAESRKAATAAEAKRLADEAREADAEADQAEQEAARTNNQETRRRATTRATKNRQKAAEARDASAKASAKASQIDIKGFDRDLLEQLPSASHMQELVQLARVEKIPSEYHAKLVDACIDDGWTTGGGRSNQVPHSILNAGKVWWFKASGRAEQVRKNAAKEQLKWKYREKTLDEFTRETLTAIKELIKALDAIKPFADQIENATLVSSVDHHLGALLSVSQAVREALPRPENVVPLDLKRLEGSY